MFNLLAFMKVIRKEKLYAFRREFPDTRFRQLFRFENGRAIFFVKVVSIRFTVIVHIRYADFSRYNTVLYRVRLLYVQTTEALLYKTVRLCSHPQALSICYNLY